MIWALTMRQGEKSNFSNLNVSPFPVVSADKRTSTRAPQTILSQGKLQCPALPSTSSTCCGKGDGEQTGHLSCFCGTQAPLGWLKRLFLALKVMFWVVFLQNPEPISVLTDCSIIPENYINRGPKIDLLFLFFFSPAFISYFLSFSLISVFFTVIFCIS